MIRARVRVLGVLLALAGAACGAGGAGASASGGGSPAPCPAAAGLPTPANDHGAVVSVGSVVSIQATDFYFAPTCVTGLRAGTVTVTASNVGAALHNLTIPSLGIDRDLPPGQSITISVEMGRSPVPFFCKYHRTAGMVGALLPSGG